MLQLKIRTKDLINYEEIKGLGKGVNTYIHKNLNTILNKAESKIGNYIYSVLTKKTGRLTRALRTTNTKLNQYGTEVGFFIDTDVAPYASTVIGEGSKTIYAKDKLLTIPFPWTKYKRVTPGMKFNKNFGKYGAWFTGDNQSKQYQFHAQREVTIRKRVDPETIQNMFEDTVDIGIDRLLPRAIAFAIKNK